MQRTTVSSSNIVSIGYDPTTETLEVEFENSIYQFDGVSAELHQALMAAPSKGSFFYHNIRDQFETTKL